MLLEMGRPEQALAEYEKSMKTDPNRFNGLAGAGRAAELSHPSEKAKAYYAQLLKNCDNGAHSDRPEPDPGTIVHSIKWRREKSAAG
jgi:tetratricopeptide (TPR) repeat protein